MKTLLVTGGAGFIGSNFIRWMFKNTENIHIVNMDALTYAGNMDNIRDLGAGTKHTFIHGDIRNKSKVEEVFQHYEIDQVINFAAESHVDRSIDGPDVFVTTNVVGTQTLLDVALKYWKADPLNKNCLEFKDKVKFIQISTDEVYGALGSSGYFTEETPINPNSPYAASKAGGDLLVMAYHRTYGLPVNITRCSNNYGPNQHAEKLIPMAISKCKQSQKIPIYGNGLQVRDWIHVKDHCSAIYAVLENGVSGEVYNIGGNNELTNIDLVKRILRELNKSEDMIAFVQDRLGHDYRYAIDSTKIKTELGWESTVSFEEGLKDTIRWYLENEI